MKKKISFILALAMVLTMVMAGCSSKNDTTESAPETSSESTTAGSTEAAGNTEATEKTEDTTAASESTTAATEAGTQAPAQKPTENTKPTESKPGNTKPTEAKPTEAPTQAPTQAPTEAKPASKADLPSLMNKLYEGLDEVPMMLGQIELDSENIEYYVGAKDFDFVQGLASEPMIGSIAHSLVLIEVEDGTDISALKSEIREKINPRKWVCVGVEREEVVIENVGNIIFVGIDANRADHYRKQFLANAGK